MRDQVYTRSKCEKEKEGTAAARGNAAFDYTGTGGLEEARTRSYPTGGGDVGFLGPPAPTTRLDVTCL